ncbi:NAD(P)H-binding protein [Mycolicibacterium madagascariense]|uniref:NAD(P)H-binding protein n=1 Tax=Mycolicibacterium madagascariense TaxID=212765 RepID=UPI0013D6D45B|nr:NAD(P)H-binding protein [Mycolicibacterium madagascariense]MCV7012882.1 NAD(P)H-binding protein [Mycolicibacterium madagascariense]
MDVLVTGAGGAIGGVSRQVVDLLVGQGVVVRAMVRTDDSRADALRGMGAQVVVGDLTEPGDVVSALDGVQRVFFNMSVSASYLEAAIIVCAAAREHGGIEAIVAMSQMTVSQMTLTSTAESRQQRLHWLADAVMDWSGLPVTHVRPTVFLDNPLFTFLAAPGLRDRDELLLPFGTGRTSPIASVDVARVVAELLLHPAAHPRSVYDLTGPEVLTIEGLAEHYSRALGRPITGIDIPYDDWVRQVLQPLGLDPHTAQHISTMAALHRAGRYDRATKDVTEITGSPGQSVDEFVAHHREMFTP